MNRFIPTEPRVFRPHSAIPLGDKTYKPMATYKRPKHFSNAVGAVLWIVAAMLISMTFSMLDITEKRRPDVSYLRESVK